ncbi:MAG: pyridoxamine 5'-phosphate oxidase family protein [Acidobacteria bacterium]|nr:pyridoxamine 5'-phosphate oxidase family protein [Acidobacteriota bacterium]
MLILELTDIECIKVLTRLGLGRLACSHNNQPYVVPIYFAYRQRYLYSFATLGQKIEWMRANPRVCVEADEIINHHHWMSVVVQGHYEELPDTPEWKAQRILAHELLQHRAMWWEPAYVVTAHLDATAELIPIYYRIHIDHVTGRRAMPDPVEAVEPVEPTTTQKSEGWLKSILRRMRFVGPGRSSH